MADAPLEFEGPRTAYVFGHVYTTLTSGGVKTQGEPPPGDGYSTAEEAMAALEKQIALFTKDARQIAWRRKREVERFNDRYRASCRLAVWPVEGEVT